MYWRIKRDRGEMFFWNLWDGKYFDPELKNTNYVLFRSYGNLLNSESKSFNFHMKYWNFWRGKNLQKNMRYSFLEEIGSSVLEVFSEKWIFWPVISFKNGNEFEGNSESKFLLTLRNNIFAHFSFPNFFEIFFRIFFSL